MSSTDQTGLQQRSGYSADQPTGGYINNERGFGGPPRQAQGNYPPQGYPVQQSYGPSTNNGPYQVQAQELGPNEYIDKHGHVRKRTRGGKFACCLALCWCCTWPCHGPCCGGL